MDVLASLRTTEQLLEDIIVEPELVSRASLHILKLWHESYDELSSIMTSEGQTGTSSWVSPYSPGRWYPVQCEFAAMLSKKQFDRFVIPLIIAQSECLDHTLYYLDGAEHLPHLDLLLGVEKLGGIAWCSGPGQPGMNDPYWRPFYDKVQRAGKRQVINGIGARDIQSFLEGMSSEGVLVDTSCESEEEAAELEGALKLKS